MIDIVMASKNDYSKMEDAILVCKTFEVEYEVRIISAHRTPDAMFQYAKETKAQIIIAGAGGSAHLGGMLASMVDIPVIAVPLNDDIALYSNIDLPEGIPLAVMPIDGSYNAALFAIRILALNDKVLQKKYIEYRTNMSAYTLEADKNQSWKTI